MGGLPPWNCPTPQAEKAFRAFIFAELDRRIGEEADRLATHFEGAEAEAAIAAFLASDWAAQKVAKRGRGRPKVAEVERQFLFSEEATAIVGIIRDIFADYWGRRNRGRPSAVELAADYCGVPSSSVATRMKRAKARRPSN